jgi:hypothetical protein
MKTVIATLVFAVCLSAQTSWLHRARHIAAVAVCASQAADVATSWRDSHIAGLHETNGIFVSGSRLDIGRMIAVKGAICGGFAVASRFGHSRTADAVWTAAGIATAIPTAIVAIQNIELSNKKENQ